MRFSGHRHTEAAKQKISAARKKQIPPTLGKHWKLSVKTRKKISKARLGTKASPATKQKISLGGKRRYKNPVERLRTSLQLLGNKHLLGHRHSAKTKKLIGAATRKFHKKYGHPMQGRQHSPEARAKMSRAQKLRRNRMSRQERKELAIRLSAANNQECPNKKERQLDNFIQKRFPGEFSLNVFGEVIINRCVPDWVNCNGKKVLIELFGDYWHGKVKTGNSPEQEENLRRKVFSKYGFKTAIIWERELRNEKLVLRKIQRALEG